jgi:hypothetical protein
MDRYHLAYDLRALERAIVNLHHLISHKAFEVFGTPYIALIPSASNQILDWILDHDLTSIL